VTIKIREKHNLNSIIRIVEKKKPIILTLRSTDSRLNNKVIDFYNHFISKGKLIETRVLTKKVNKKHRNMISFKLLSPFFILLRECKNPAGFFTLTQPGETHLHNEDVRPMTEKEVKCGSVAANAKLKS